MHIGLLRAQMFDDVDLQTFDMLRQSGNIRWEEKVKQITEKSNN